MHSGARTFGLGTETQQKILTAYRETGYGYGDYSGRVGLGISVTSDALVQRLARDAGAWEPVMYLENGWHAIQDVYAFAKLRA
jgi:hypothetical protein